MSAPIAPTLLPLTDHRATDAHLTGGKASALARLAAAGHPVPAGFVLTPAAFEPGAPALRLRPAVRAALAEALPALGGAVAVRSSGVAEDLAGASFAGQYETVLDVEGIDAVERAVATCLASAGAARVQAYLAERGVAAAPMAVLVRRMVPARAAGVAFTAHPVTGEREVCVVSAVRGLGEALVSGATDAEEWEVRAAPSRRRGVQAVLTEAEAGAVAALARAVGAGAPTDVEWALGPEGLALLQARPMTALPAPVDWTPPAEGGFIRNFRLGEWIGAPVTPLFESWVLTDLEEGVHAHFERLCGLPSPRPLHVVVNGWYFYGGMSFEPGGLPMLRALPRVLGAMLVRETRHQLLAAIPPLAHLGFDGELARWRRDLLPELGRTVAEAEAALGAASPPEAVALVQSVVDATARQLASIVGVAGYAAKAELRLLEFWQKHLRDHDGTLFELVSGADHAPAAHDVEGLDPIFPTRGELGPVPPPDTERRADLAARRDAAEARALAALPPRRRATLVRLVAEARRAHAARIEQTGVLTLGWPVLRRALLGLGVALVARGVIAGRDDIFFVTRAELMAALAGDGHRPPVGERRATWERQRGLAPPLVVGEPRGLLKEVMAEIASRLHHEEHDASDALVGMPGSPGRVTGPARIVRSVEELGRLQPGEILVAPVTTPLWTLAFGRALAVVTDTGSVASHASIVAREHGIPAVVGTADATRRIADGQRITVDGGRGVVRLLGEG